MLGFIVDLLARLVGLLPASAALRLGKFLGLVWFHIVRIRRRTVESALAATFPDWDRRAVRRVARELYLNLGRHAVEFLRAVRGRPLPPVVVEGLERYEKALAEGRGVIVATAHAGNWDLAACSQARAGRRLVLLSRRLSNRSLDRRWMRWRRRFGLEILDEGAPVGEMTAILRGGGALVLLIDQATPADRGGVRVPFLGRLAWTTRLPALLSLRTGAPVLPVFAESRPDGSHVVHVETPVTVEGGCAGAPVPVAERALRMTAALSQRLDARVRAHPEQWLWLHRRWKDFP